MSETRSARGIRAEGSLWPTSSSSSSSSPPPPPHRWRGQTQASGGRKSGRLASSRRRRTAPRLCNCVIFLTIAFYLGLTRWIHRRCSYSFLTTGRGNHQRRKMYDAYPDWTDRFLRQQEPLPIHRISRERIANRLMLTNSDDTDAFCVRWSVDMDGWWIQYWPEWRIGLQNSTAQCFERIVDPHQLQVYQRLAAFQFPVGTKQPESILVKFYTGSGWGVDVAHMVDGLRSAVDSPSNSSENNDDNNNNNVSVVLVSPRNWKYIPSSSDPLSSTSTTAAPANLCPSNDIFCYFLPIHNLSSSSLSSSFPQQALQQPVRFLHRWQGFTSTPTTLHLLEFMTRSQTWLRREGARVASDTLSMPPFSSLSSSGGGAAGSPPLCCVTFHVRRGDVVLHGKFSRRYHAVSEYMDAYRIYQKGQQQPFLPYDFAGWLSSSRQYPLPDLREILLLTDDANAIVEATMLHQAYEWRYINRPRFAGPEGGWENPIPSGNATWEVIVLQAMSQLMRWQARNCDVPVLVHSKSNLADYLYAHLLMDNPRAVRIDLDQDGTKRVVHSLDNVKSVKLSRRAS